MKGFTLIETLVYMAISAIISTSLISLAFTLSDANARLRQDLQDESVGLFVLRVVENNLRNKIEIDPAIVASDAQIHDVLKSKIDNTSTVSFMINNKTFSISVYEK